ncbi:Diaminopimelate decarboxylase [Streptomyces californicus]
MPRLVIEPGRAIAAPAGVALYRVLAVKHTGRTLFVAVDGGMSDNPRPALYGARYAPRLVGRVPTAGPVAATVVGRHCEAGDVLAADVPLPGDVPPAISSRCRWRAPTRCPWPPPLQPRRPAAGRRGPRRYGPAADPARDAGGPATTRRGGLSERPDAGRGTPGPERRGGLGGAAARVQGPEPGSVPAPSAPGHAVRRCGGPFPCPRRARPATLRSRTRPRFRTHAERARPRCAAARGPVSVPASDRRQGGPVLVWTPSRRLNPRVNPRFPLLGRTADLLSLPLIHQEYPRWPIWPSSPPRPRYSRWWLSSPEG